MWKWIGLGLSIAMIVLFSVLALGVFNFGVNIYNDMTYGRVQVYKAIGGIKTEYQRRWDLIPNICEAVKGYMKHEKGTLQAVIEARASATKVELTPENLKEMAQVDDNLSKAIGRLLITIEQYPLLKADKHITDLMADLRLAEEYIAQSRNNYNEVVGKYNSFIQKFPQTILAGWYGFKTFQFFELVSKEAENAPKIQI